MTIDLDDYRVQVEEIRKFLSTKNDWIYKEQVGMLAIYCSTPIIAVSYYIAELYGMTDEIRDKIDRDSEFYKVTKVFNYRPKSV